MSLVVLGCFCFGYFSVFCCGDAIIKEIWFESLFTLDQLELTNTASSAKDPTLKSVELQHSTVVTKQSVKKLTLDMILAFIYLRPPGILPSQPVLSP